VTVGGDIVVVSHSHGLGKEKYVFSWYERGREVRRKGDGIAAEGSSFSKRNKFLKNVGAISLRVRKFLIM
jgi:hypothetical protein